jgi:tellurite resistance protein
MKTYVATQSPLQQGFYDEGENIEWDRRMSLFDQVMDRASAGTGGESSGANAAEAFAGIALAAVASDGFLSEEEAQIIPFTLTRMKLYDGYSDNDMRRLFDKLLAQLQREGVEALFTSAKEALSPELRETAFAIAADLVLVDGVITPEERSFLDDLYDILEISESVATQVIEVMAIKNRG